MNWYTDALTPAEIDEAANTVRQKIDYPIQVALVLGSGLGKMAEILEKTTVIPYNEIPNFPVSTVKGHEGSLVFGFYNNTSVVFMKGRFHLYEGYHPTRVATGIRLFAKLDIRNILLTNAAGAVNKSFKPGDLMLITDHINLLNSNALNGKHHEEWGERFVDLSNAYSPKINKLIRHAAKSLKIKLQEGIYGANPGPNYETPAEIKMLSILGLDAVGMSTVPEVIVANQEGIDTAAISLITNMGAGLEKDSLNHHEVMEIAAESYPDLEKILKQVIGGIGST